MGFFDNYQDAPSGDYVGSAEKAVLMQNGIPFVITSIFLDEANKFGPRYVASVNLPDPATGDEAPRLISFPIGTVESRDRMLGEMVKYLEGDEAEEVRVKLEKVDRSILVRPA